MLGEVVDSSRKLLGVHLPVSQTGVVGVSCVFSVSEPSVIEDKHLDSYLCCVVDHVCDRLLVEVHVGPFPAVEHHRAFHVGMGEGMVAYPVMKVARHLPASLVAECPYHIRGCEALAVVKIVGGGEVIYAADHIHASAFILFEGQLVIAGPCKCTSIDISVVLTRRPVERQQEGGIRCLGGLYSPF